MTRLSEDQITALFREPRTMRKFLIGPSLMISFGRFRNLPIWGPRPSIASLCVSPGLRALLDAGLMTGADFEAIAADAVLLGEQDQ